MTLRQGESPVLLAHLDPKLLVAQGITPDKQVASYCNGGARGALGAFVLQVLGYERGQAYAGSFQQWSNQPDTIVER